MNNQHNATMEQIGVDTHGEDWVIVTKQQYETWEESVHQSNVYKLLEKACTGGIILSGVVVLAAIWFSNWQIALAAILTMIASLISGIFLEKKRVNMKTQNVTRTTENRNYNLW